MSLLKLSTLGSILAEAWTMLGMMAPYILLGFGVAGLLSIFISPETVERQLGNRRPYWSVILATLYSIPLPLCSCGVIPVAASLRKHGASKGATTSFLLTTPQTGMDNILAVYSLLGPVFAVFSPLVALVNGLLGGTLVTLCDTRDPEKIKIPSCQDDCCRPHQPRNHLSRLLSYAFVTLPKDIASPLLWGLLVAGVIDFLVPDDFFSRYLGAGITQKLVMMMLATPLYVCATASIPLAAALMAKGVSAGAALAFLVTGPGTNAATIAIIWKMMGKRTAALYLGTIVTTSLGLGTLLDYLYTFPGIPAPAHFHAESPGWFEGTCSVVLLAILVHALRPCKIKTAPATASPSLPASPARDYSELVRLAITGMDCQHCATAVTLALQGFPGIAAVMVTVSPPEVCLRGKNFDLSAVSGKIEELGYKVTRVIRPDPS